MKKKIVHTIFFAVLVAIMFTGHAWGKRSLGYTPPPYWVRVSLSFMELFPISIIVTLLFYLLMWRINPEQCRINRKLFLKIAFFLLMAGCFIAATDALNDEGWNPALYGSIFIALSIPVGFVLLNKCKSVVIRFLVWLLAAVPLRIGLFMIGMPLKGWQEWVGLSIK